MRRHLVRGVALCMVLPAAIGAAGEFVCDRGAAAALAAPREFDALTGDDPVNYPPDPLVRYQHLKLTIRIEDVARKELNGLAEYTLRAIAPGVHAMRLDAVGFDDVQVTVNGQPATAAYDDAQIQIPFAEELSTSADTAVAIRYRVRDPQDGMFFLPADAAYPDRPVSLHTQGQTESNRYWFPCHDSPNVKFTSEMVATVPKPLSAISNGKLIERIDEPGGKLATFHYRQDVPHVAYLVTLAAADFDVQTDDLHGTPVEYWVPRGWAADTRRTFARTPKMIEHFATLTGAAYPYAKYAQVVAPGYGGGGMENISATTLTETCVLDQRALLDGDSDSLIAHELAHQWFGDLLTCRTWAHIWLNEGFASYFDDLWFEHDRGADWYECSYRRTYRRVAQLDPAGSPGALVYRDSDGPDEPFRHKGALAYSKGSSVLATLRHELGDAVFFAGLQRYVKQFAAQNVETEDLRHALEEASGRSLARFFEQYCYRPGTPTIAVRYHWDAEHKRVELSFRQTQKIDAQSPAFAVPIDVDLLGPSADTHHTFELTRRADTLRIPRDAEPTAVCVDAHAGLLARLNVELPRAMWMHLLKKGPTAVSRMDAARELGESARPGDVEPLAACLRDAHEFWMVRTEAADSLGRIRTDASRDALVKALASAETLADARVRAAAVAALSEFRGDAAVIETVTRYAREDASRAVEVRATEALGELRATSAAEVLLANLSRPSRFDRLRGAAISALTDLEDTRAADAAMKAAASGTFFRTRAGIVRDLGRIGRLTEPPQRREIRLFLEQMLNDPQARLERSAVGALAELGDDAAIPALQARAEQNFGHDVPTRAGLRRAIDDAVKSLRAKSSESSAVRDLRQEVQRLSNELRDLRRTVDPSGGGGDGPTSRPSRRRGGRGRPGG
ncbi:MAG: M1 family aminopeptidase [Phycisphaerae bacterium]